MIRSAARRVSSLVVLLGAAVAGFSVVAVLAGASPQRGVSLGLYAVGSLTAVFGFALGTRSSFRSAHRTNPVGSGERPDSWETTEVSILLIVIGLVFLAVGIAVDARVRLV